MAMRDIASHAERRGVVAVPENREDRAAAALIYGVIAPFAARHPAAVQRQQLVQFVAVEEGRSARGVDLVKTIELGHGTG